MNVEQKIDKIEGNWQGMKCLFERITKIEVAKIRSLVLAFYRV